MASKGDTTISNSMNGKSIKVKIFGSEYPLRGENEEITKKIAAYVDSMLNKIHDKLPEQQPLTVAVLSALNITEDLMKEKEHNERTVNHVETELAKLSNYLDNCLALESEESRSHS